MRKAINGTLWLIGLAVVLGVYFFVPIGRYTLFEHTLRIAATEPARELGQELGDAARDVGERALDEWREREPIRARARDGAGDPAPEADLLRLRLERDGVRVGDDLLTMDELRARVREARRVTGELSAILETAAGVPPPEVDALLELLREENVAVEVAAPGGAELRARP